MSTVSGEAPQAARPSTAPEPVVASSHRRTVAVLGVVALVVGIAGGYLLRWGIEPSRPAPATVAAAAYTSSTEARADVYFDGSRAFYAGPAELKAGTQLTIRFTTTVADASLVVSRLDPAPTWERLLRDLADANTALAPMPLSYVDNVAGIQGSGRAVVSLRHPGVYSVWAGPVAGQATVTVATMLRVAG